MKEFEKVFNRRIERTIKLSISMNNPGGMSKKEIAKLVWKEALEWAKDEEQWQSPGWAIPVYIIDEELEDEN